jgi:hypothetical protein
MRFTDAVTVGKDLVDPRQGNDLFLPNDPDSPNCKYGACYRGMALVGSHTIKLPLTDIAEEDEGEGIDLTTDLTNTWPWLTQVETVYPCSCTRTDVYGNPLRLTVAHVMAHLWDEHVEHGPFAVPHDAVLYDPWTFERITEWVKSIEPADEVPTKPQV